MTADDAGIRTYLAQGAAFRRAHMPVADSRYGSYDELVLDQGILFTDTGLPLPDDIPRGEMRNCYENAILAVIRRPDLFYVEGYAASTLVGMPVLHAWLVDADGNVYDPTWTAGGTYYGVPLDLEWVIDKVTDSGYYGILANDWMTKGEPIPVAGFPKKALARPWRKEIAGRPKTVNPAVAEAAVQIGAAIEKAAAMKAAG